MFSWQISKRDEELKSLKPPLQSHVDALTQLLNDLVKSRELTVDSMALREGAVQCFRDAVKKVNPGT